tara:strand:- start:7192 stop:9378 length:2187 start_codon:yes stop_codon:yes gene_type:complete
MATKRNTPRQNYGNPFSAGSSVAQGAALTAPGFVDYSKFFDTSATPGLQAAQQGLFTQIAIANETHAKNMENILPADFDETQLAPGSVDGTYAMLRGLKDQAFNLSRQAANLRGTKEGDMAQMELNKIKSQMSKHYGNNVEYNSMMIDHNKNKDFYSTSYNFMPGKAEKYQKYVKFVDPSAKISYDGKTMMIESKDGDKISFEELKKLEPAMKQTELNLGVETLGVDVISKSLNGTTVTDGEIDLKLNALITKANLDNGNIQDGILSLATDLTFKHGNDEFNFYSYLNSNPELKSKYLTEDGKFKTFEDPTQRDTYYKELEKDVKNYFRNSMTAARDENIAAFEDKQAKALSDKLNAEKELVTFKSNEQIRVRNATFNPQGGVGLQESEDQLIARMKYINDAVDRGDLSVFQAYGLDGKNALDISQDENGIVDINMYGTDPSVSGTYGLDNSSSIFTGQAQTPEDKTKLKQALFNTIIGKKWTNLSEKAGVDLNTPSPTPAGGDGGTGLGFDPLQLSSLQNIDNMNSKELGTLIDKIDNQNQDTQSFGEGGATFTIDGQTLTETDKTNLLNSLNKIQDEKIGLENEDDDVKDALQLVTDLQWRNFRYRGINESDGSVNYKDGNIKAHKAYTVLKELDEMLNTRKLSPNAEAQIRDAIEYLKNLSEGKITDVSQLKYYGGDMINKIMKSRNTSSTGSTKKVEENPFESGQGPSVFAANTTTTNEFPLLG